VKFFLFELRKLKAESIQRMES